jgi:dipeptidyl aminopeptidase/acylaminoacyl peptidase
MSSSDLDRRLTGWFESAGAEYVPQGLLDDVFTVTRASGQRRGPIARLVSAAMNAWEMPTILRVAPRQVFYLAVVALLILAAVLAIAAVGARRPALPFGLAENGLVAFDRDGAIVTGRPDRTTLSERTTIPNGRGPVYAPDGRRFAFYRTVDGVEMIMVASANGRDPIALSAGIVIDELAMETPASWSPDSQSIVFGGLSGGQRRLFVARVDGSDTHVVGADGLSRIDPAWSPDGAWIAFHGFHPEEDSAAGPDRTQAGLYTIRPDGRDEMLLVRGTGGDFVYRRPQWLPAPERRVLAYAIGEPSSYDIALFDVASMTERVIAPVGAAELWPAWAPDGAKLAWATSDATIRIANSDGTIIRTLPQDVDYQLVWSPDGRFLFGWANEAREALAVMSSDGSSATALIPLEGSSRSHWTWQRLAP